MKIYARQVAPEDQESPLFFGDETFPENINVFGNREYKSPTSDVFDRVCKALYGGELLGEWEKINYNGGGWYNSWKEALDDLLPPEGRAAYTREERKKIPEILSRFEGCFTREENPIICELLEIVTGKSWDYNIIRGNCQGDWQGVIYPSDEWTREQLNVFETEYFNTGSEWIIHDEDSIPESPEDIEGYSIYCHGWSDDQIRAEILEHCGKPGDEVVLYKFDRYIITRTASYSLV